MGLGLYTKAALDAGSFPGPSTSSLQKITETATRFMTARKLSAFFSHKNSGNHLDLFLHPAAEPVEFELLEGGTITCSAKTSGAGPGYHQFAVELLDTVSQELRTTWTWDDELGGFLDETGYAQHRNYHKLQGEMKNMLRDIATSVVSKAHNAGVGSFMLNMPIGYGATSDDEVLSPLGGWPLEEFKAFVDGDGEDFAERFFPWWESGPTDKFWHNLGLVTMWMDVWWRPPESDSERAALHRSLFCFEQARTLNSKLQLPEVELAEADYLLSAPSSEAIVPREDGVGFRRRPWRQELMGGWTMHVPGYFREELRDDGTTLVYWYGNRELWISTFSFQPVRPPNLEKFFEKAEPENWVVDHFGIVGRAAIKHKVAEEGDEHFTISCNLEGPGSAATVTIIVPDESHFGWAKEVFESVRLLSPKNNG